MRKDSAIITGVSVLLSVAIVGGLYVLDRGRQSRYAAPSAHDTGNQLDSGPPSFTSVQDPKSPSHGNPDGSAANMRTDQIIECDHPNLGKVYTNAATCEGADLGNRISIAESMPMNPTAAEFDDKSYHSPEDDAGNSKTNRPPQEKKPNLHSNGKEPPSNLSVSCKFSVGRALEIERDLSAADDPAESIWKESYCEWLEEAREENCRVPANYFYYSDLCPMWPSLRVEREET